MNIRIYKPQTYLFEYLVIVVALCAPRVPLSRTKYGHKAHQEPQWTQRLLQNGQSIKVK